MDVTQTSHTECKRSLLLQPFDSSLSYVSGHIGHSSHTLWRFKGSYGPFRFLKNLKIISLSKLLSFTTLMALCLLFKKVILTAVFLFYFFSSSKTLKFTWWIELKMILPEGQNGDFPSPGRDQSGSLHCIQQQAVNSSAPQSTSLLLSNFKLLL